MSCSPVMIQTTELYQLCCDRNDLYLSHAPPPGCLFLLYILGTGATTSTSVMQRLLSLPLLRLLLLYKILPDSCSWSWQPYVAYISTRNRLLLFVRSVQPLRLGPCLLFAIFSFRPLASFHCACSARRRHSLCSCFPCRRYAPKFDGSYIRRKWQYKQEQGGSRCWQRRQNVENGKRTSSSTFFSCP